MRLPRRSPASTARPPLDVAQQPGPACAPDSSTLASDGAPRKARVTQTDIARVARVHNTTVSLALRNSPLIPAATRDRIQALARQLGYCPDPALQALVAYRKGCRPHATGETLAYVTRWHTQWGWSRLPAEGTHYLAAKQKAEELGYHLEHFWLGEPGMNPRRLDQVLLHRGIRGVIFGAAHAACEDLTELSWSRLCAVRISGLPLTPPLHHITLDPVAVIRLAMQHVLFAGYRRIGLVLPQTWDKLTDQVWSAAFQAEQFRCHLKDRLPVLQLQGPPEEAEAAGLSSHDAANDAASLLFWYRQYRPEVVLGTTPTMLQHIRQSGFQVPHDFAYANLLMPAATPGHAGVRVNHARVGELAVEMLAGQLQQNALGVPAIATVTSVGGTWCEGASLPTPASVPAIAPTLISSS
ncbi:trehalose repressor [Lacunisphaera limnophila]|uniref:Trehalose repressor n=1 Tax=Lacunisphaera limnophila TaxID=1838286 RepID=A0A1D8ASQ8_9BACT|nr:LacI family DNA-binding transcriptional regulator [Lacunisphaera limnophila]AOS43935.1 trehalose repressor [Lacunisphaera limnophila]